VSSRRARAAAKARRAARFGQPLAEAPGQLEQLPDDVLAALASRSRPGCVAAGDCAAAAHSRRRRAGLRADDASAGGDDGDDSEEERAEARARRAKRRARLPQPGDLLRADARTSVAVLSRDPLSAAGSGVPEAAAAFVHARLVARHKRSRGVDGGGVPLDFASSVA